MRNPTSTFPVTAVLGESDRARFLRVRTEHGPELDVWLSKRCTSFYQYKLDGELRMEVIGPDWLAVKAGLIEEETNHGEV